MCIRVVGAVHKIELIAAGNGIRDLGRLTKIYGGRRWKKMKGEAIVELPDGSHCLAEVHWYEARGLGRKEMKIKRLLE